MGTISPLQSRSPVSTFQSASKPAAASLVAPRPLFDLGQLVNELKMGVDVFEHAVLPQLGKIFGVDQPSDGDKDGQLVGAGGQTFKPGTPLADIPGVTPKNNPNPSETILYTNGIMTTVGAQGKEMQAIADSSGAKVIGIHNATNGLVTDLAQCLTDKADKGTNPAVDTLADAMYTELKAGRDVHVMGYSQGGLDTARALFHLQNKLRVEDGLSQSDAEKVMSHLKVETFGAASFRYPDGPKYVHYINNADAVPTLTGLGGSIDPLEFAKQAGRGAVVHRYNDPSVDLISNHMLATQYLNHRVGFDDARNGKFID